MPRDPNPLPEQATTHMVFMVRGGPFGGKMREIYFQSGDRPRVGKRFELALPEKVWKAFTKGIGKPGFVPYEVTKLPQEREIGSLGQLNSDVGELVYVNPQGVLEF